MILHIQPGKVMNRIVLVIALLACCGITYMVATRNRTIGPNPNRAVTATQASAPPATQQLDLDDFKRFAQSLPPIMKRECDQEARELDQRENQQLPADIATTEHSNDFVVNRLDIVRTDSVIHPVAGFANFDWMESAKIGGKPHVGGFRSLEATFAKDGGKWSVIQATEIDGGKRIDRTHADFLVRAVAAGNTTSK